MIELDKNAIPTKLLWVDLEMTGLDVAKDLIVEVAVEVTDLDFKTLASYEAILAKNYNNAGNLIDDKKP